MATRGVAGAGKIIPAQGFALGAHWGVAFGLEPFSMCVLFHDFKSQDGTPWVFKVPLA